MNMPDCKIIDARNAANVDTHFNIYHELMQQKVQEILLVASLYDAYILEEDGSLASKIIHEYSGLNLSRPPRLTKAFTAAEAVAILSQKHFDLVIAMPHLEDMDPFELGATLKKRQPNLPVILLAHGTRALAPLGEIKSSEAIDSIFIWTGDSDLLLALVKNTEDRMNVGCDTQNAMVRVLILVEDSPLYRSILLPLIYKEIVNQTQAVMEEGLNEEHQLLKMRARPKILVAGTYEEAWELYKTYQPYIFGVLSDARYPKDGRMTADAGIELLKQIHADVPYLPLLLLSSETENREKAEQIPAVFVDKNSPALASALHDYFLHYLGFGDFVFRQADGKEIGRAHNLKALEDLLPLLPDEPVYYEASRNRFSNWFMARSEITFASMLSKISASEFLDVKQMKQFIVKSIRSLRQFRQKGVVVQFSREDYDPEISDFLKIGHGSLGGKARGLAFLSHLLRQRSEFIKKFSTVDINIPKSLVLTTEGFESFISANHLQDLAESSVSDEEISKLFLEAQMPMWVEDALVGFLSKTAYPLSIRSSSLLEDAHFFPYAGLYKTFMIPNNHPDINVRLDQLATAVKLVYASTYFEGPRRFSKSTSQQFRKEQMAVILQELKGARHGDYLYPTLSGIARSRNDYPVGPMTAEDGVALIALGMGKMLEEAGGGLRFSPRHPTVLPYFSKVEDILEGAQRHFYALEISDRQKDLSFDRGMILTRRSIDEAVDEFPVRILSSLYNPDDHRLRDVATGAGFRVLTFSRILKYDRFPLSEILCELLEIGRKGMGCPVEFEFSVNLAEAPTTDPDSFSILQMRPMAENMNQHEVEIDAATLNRAFCYSSQSLGHGKNRTIADIVYVIPEDFDAGRTLEIAHEIRRINQALASQHRPYLLVGPGRWGSFDRFLGIPVRWDDISGVGAIVELRNQQLKADPSEGSHFFQRITSLGLYYMTVTEGSTEFFDWAWVESFPPETQTQYLKHIQLQAPFELIADGRTSRCVMFKIGA